MRSNRVLSISLVAAIAVLALCALVAALAAARPALAGNDLTLDRGAYASPPSVAPGPLGPGTKGDALQGRGTGGGAELALAAPRAQLPDPNWHKWVNGAAWSQDMVVTVETSDTIKVVDAVTTLPTQPLKLVEQWTPGQLKLLDLQIQPGGSVHSVEIGKVTWQVPEGVPKVYTMTKWFHVEPCTWTRTVLSEELFVSEQSLGQRPVTVDKVPAQLWIDSTYDPAVRPGDVAILTLHYGNAGGYENSVSIRNTFPSAAPFAWSDPAADVVSADHLTARWNVGDLAGGDTGDIVVAVAVSESAGEGSTIQVRDGIFDHLDVQRDVVTSTFTVAAPVPVTWEKTVNGQTWNPDLVVTARTSDTIQVVDTVVGGYPFLLSESWNPEHLSLDGIEVSAGKVVTGIAGIEWTLAADPGGPATLAKTFHVEPGFWDWTVLEEALTVGGAPRMRSVPVAHHYPPITFPEGDWPWYAQDEIAVHPEPPVAGEPTELCVEVVNHDPAQAHAVIAEFAVANFGIGLPFEPVGRIEVAVPPDGRATGCTMWVPPTPDHWCIEVRLLEEGQPYAISQRNVDVDEPLAPNTPHGLTFPVRNPFDHPVTITLGLIPHLQGWGLALSPDTLRNMQPGEIREVTLTVTPPVDMPENGAVVVDVQAYVGSEVIGGFRKIYRPPVILHPTPDPPYAEREITVHPYPALAGQPTEICVELRNPTAVPQDVNVQFSWAAFGIGLPFTPIDGLRSVHLPPHSTVVECIHWIPPLSGHVCLQVALFMEGYAPQRSQRNIDVNELLRPNVPDAFTFPVGNPFDHPVTITLGVIPHLPDWGVELSQDVLPNVPAGEVREVTLTVTPPGELPDDRALVVDVEAYVGGELIGGFRKVFRPPVILHPFPDPPYAEREITVEPYPALAGRPSEICVELRNPSPYPRDVEVQFSWAAFGIGLPFTPIDGLRPVHLPPYSVVKECINWVPPLSGHVCLQVALFAEGYPTQRSQRNIDVNEPLAPLTSHAMAFPVGNPFEYPVTVTLGLIPHFPDWGLELSQDVLPDMAPGEVREVVLTVTPPSDLPADGDPIVDVEAYVEGRLIGGFRKIFRPPVPVHQPRDPVYAESEISVDPYPAVAGMPTRLGVEVFNPTDQDQVVAARFSVAPFGIGLPFETAHIAPNPIQIFVPAHGAARGYTIWEPPVWSGRFCVQVQLEMPGREPIWSQRNIDVGEPLRPGQPHQLVFRVGNPLDQVATIALGLVPHRAGWEFGLNPDTLPNLQPGQQVSVTLTVVPPLEEPLGTGEPIVDVEAYVGGELIGGFRKMDVPPVPIHKPHEPGYAESEISIDPYPLQQGQPTSVSTVVQNSSDAPVTIDLEFGWAKFGMGIPFTTTGMVPPTRTVTLGAGMTETVGVTWTPPQGGHQCVQVRLSDPNGTYEPQRSQRNVDVAERPPCGVTKVFHFTVYNDSPVAVTVDIGMVAFNVPAEWQVTTVPSGTMEIGPYGEGVVTVLVQIPCPATTTALRAAQVVAAMQQAAGGVPTIDVEGYVAGDLVGGIEIQFEPEWTVYLPVVLRNR
jgi:hypothetical protein